ncbi:MAG: shikimate kinase [Clostridiaceae bacterium]|nr:shikimate kinase [Clostridiaceae bacterium]MBW4859860.1 shikimate kinase [Clostridiaceae bacterium]MBW4869710.1 shikimate kinase [Clostridiaceae bacterium]
MKNIVLIGPSGVGKTTIGKYISSKLKIEHIDTDFLIERKFAMSIEDIFGKHGENWFRVEESNIVKEVSNKNNIVISTGGGVVINEKNIENLKSTGILFLLVASIDTLTRNLIKSNKKRPLIGNYGYAEIYKKVKNIFFQREKLYLKSADYLISVDNRTIEGIGEEIIYFYKKH